MKIIAISDTHTMERSIRDIPDGDVLIHAGDITGNGQSWQIIEFCNWIKELPHKHKIVIAGNHDSCFEKDNKNRNVVIDYINNVATYLEDSEIIIDGIKFYGSPWQPEFCNWSFNLPRGKALKEKWDLIPLDTQVLITHGPPANILDWCPGGNVGCLDLKIAMQNLVNLKAHIFGHIHEGYGIEVIGGTTYANASICNDKYNPINKPIVVEI